MLYGHGGDIYTYEKDMLDFSVNVNPMGPSERVIEAVKRSAANISAYPDIRCRALGRRLAERLEVPADHLVFGNGAAELIYTLALAGKPEKALLPVPAFSEYEQALNTAGCTVEYEETKRENGFTIDEHFPDRLSRETDILFLASPANPSGRAAEREVLLRTAERCEELGIRFVLDECFLEFLPDGEKRSLIRETGRFRTLFVLRAFTKIHAMPGLRLGYGVTSDRGLMEQISQVRQPWSVSVPAQEAGLAALEDAEAGRVERTARMIGAERRHMEEEMQNLGIEFVSSDANFILFRSDKDLFHALESRGILIRDCSDYRGLGKGWYRIAVRTEEENERLIREIKSILTF